MVAEVPNTYVQGLNDMQPSATSPGPLAHQAVGITPECAKKATVPSPCPEQLTDFVMVAFLGGTCESCTFALLVHRRVSHAAHDDR